MNKAILPSFFLAGTLCLAPIVGNAHFSPEAANPDPTSEKILCKDLPPPVGTRMRPRKICKTEAEWAAIEQDQKDVLNRIQKKPLQN